jgi:hypothetical protein
MSAEIQVKYNLVMQLDGTWRLQIWTSKAEGVSSKIFVYQHLNDVPYDDSSRDIFVNIAQPNDLVEYPEDAPDGTTRFFRKEYMDVNITSSELAYKSLERINNDIDHLCKALNLL